MRWDALDRWFGYTAAGMALAAVLFLYPCADRGSTAAAAVGRSCMTREQVAARLGTDGRDTTGAEPSFALSIKPSDPNKWYHVQRYAEGLETLFVKERTYTGLFFTLTVSYYRMRVTTVEVRNPTWDPRTWPGAVVALLAAAAAGFGAAEGARHVRRQCAEAPLPA
jgi:hypothetical protein